MGEFFVFPSEEVLKPSTCFRRREGDRDEKLADLPKKTSKKTRKNVIFPLDFLTGAKMMFSFREKNTLQEI